MENELIEKWLSIEYSSGNGYGYGDGSGSGSGCGDGYGDGSRYGFGSGSGCGDGSGDGSGDGYGYGSGNGYGSGDGYRYGNGYGSGIKKFNEHYIYNIDSVPTIITRIRNNVAKGYILNQDLTLETTYIVKGSNMFSHGTTIKEAMSNLEEKILRDLDIVEKIKRFEETFDKNKSYKGHDFYKWHHLLTGSCKQGRDNFVRNNNLDLDSQYTVKEFLNIVKNQYGWNYLKELAKDYE